MPNMRQMYIVRHVRPLRLQVSLELFAPRHWGMPAAPVQRLEPCWERPKTISTAWKQQKIPVTSPDLFEKHSQNSCKKNQHAKPLRFHKIAICENYEIK